MIEPTGYTALDLIGFTDRGAYDPTANYVKNDIVTVGNTKWRCKVDDTIGVTPAENANWTIYLESATSLAGMDDTDIVSPKNGDGLVHDGNDWTNIPIMTKEQWKKNGAYNLLPNNGVTQVAFGLTFTFNPTGYKKGVVHVTGTKSDSGGHGIDMGTSLSDRLFTLKAGTYKILDGVSADNANLDIELYNYTTSTLIKKTRDSHAEVFTLSEDAVCFCNISYRGAENTVFDDYIYPIITTDLNATPADYEPYAKTNRELTEDWNTVIGPLSFTYSNGLTSSDVVIYAYRYGKIVVISFICPNKNLLPAAAWGTLAIANGFPKPVSDGGNYTQAVHGRTVTNNSPYIFTMTSTGAFMLRKQDNSTSSDSMQAYEGGIIVYLTTD